MRSSPVRISEAFASHRSATGAGNFSEPILGQSALWMNTCKCYCSESIMNPYNIYPCRHDASKWKANISEYCYEYIWPEAIKLISDNTYRCQGFSLPFSRVLVLLQRASSWLYSTCAMTGSTAPVEHSLSVRPTEPENPVWPLCVYMNPKHTCKLKFKKYEKYSCTSGDSIKYIKKVLLVSHIKNKYQRLFTWYFLSFMKSI
jgi:hypothetical protein